jgi:ATP-binding cassette subfamily B protein RaxB
MSDLLELGLRRRGRVRLIRQTEIAECGLACIAMVGSFHGLDVDLGSLRRQFAPSLRGSSLKSLIATADQLGFAPRAVKLALEDLPSLNLPAVLHWDLSHYVVLERFERDRALIHDPGRGSRWMSLGEISPHFTGVALELRLTDTFEPSSDRERLRLRQLWQRMTGLPSVLLQTLILSLVLQVYVVASPYYMQVAIDNALPAQDSNFLAVLAIGFGLFLLIYVGASLLRSFVLLAAGTQLGFALSVNIARRLFRLPADWFEKRHMGDILSRFQSIKPIQQALTAGPASTLVDGAMAVITLAVMFFYSAILGFLALFAALLYVGARLISLPGQLAAQEEVIIAEGRSQGIMIESLRGITTLRLFNKEAQRLGLWQSSLADATNASAHLQRIGIWQQIAQLLIFGLEGVISIWLAIGLVIGGGFSLGMVFAFMAYKLQFLTKAASLVDFGISFRMLVLHLRRLSDIALSSEDLSFGSNATAGTKLIGRIELKGIVYRYSPSDPVVLDRVDLLIEPGEHLAITGPSGGGKSTLVKVLLGLVEPVAGEVLVDGMPLSRFGYKSYHDQIGAVLQEDSLFAGSVFDNIALFDEAPDQERVIAAAITACIHDDLSAMPMGYETLVGDMGSTLSGGQKQRVLLARALYRQPRILVMDEGTSHLDGAHEKRVNDAICALGITRVIIAHRAETLTSADRVIHLHHGLLLGGQHPDMTTVRVD